MHADISVPRPILIIGAGRSGTTVLTWALGQHPNIIATPETNWLSALASYLGAFHEIGAVNAAAHLTVFDIDRRFFFQQFGRAVNTLVLDSFEAKFAERRAGPAIEWQDGIYWTRHANDPKRRWADGTPSNTPYVAALARMFPQARFINLVRNPVDVVHSWLGVPWRAPDHADPRALIDHIRHSQRIGYLAESAFGPDRVMRVLFDDLVLRPADHMKAIAEFIGEDYAADMIEPLTGTKINSTGGRKADFDAELATVRSDPLLLEMEKWHRAARDAGWRIADQQDAISELAAYANWKIPIS